MVVIGEEPLFERDAATVALGSLLVFESEVGGRVAVHHFWEYIEELEHKIHEKDHHHKVNKEVHGIESSEVYSSITFLCQV